MDEQSRPELHGGILDGCAKRTCRISRRVGQAPIDHPNLANMKDGVACCELALTFYGEANRAIQAELWFAGSAVAAAALEAMLLVKMFMNTDAVAQLASFKKLLDKYQGDFGRFAPKRDGLGQAP
jgi:hypothetical protein